MKSSPTPRRFTALRSAAFPLLLAAVLPLAGTAGCAALKQGVPRPEASVQKVRLTELGLEGLTLNADLRVTNPFSVDVPLSSASYSLISGDTQIVAGEAETGGTLPAHDATVVSVPVRVVFADLLRVMQGVKPGQVLPYRLGLNLVVDAPALGPVRIPVSATGELPIPTVPGIAVSGVQWQTLSPTEARAAVTVHLTNGNTFPVSLDRMDYRLSFQDRQVAAGELDQQAELAGGAARDLTVDVSFSPLSVGTTLLDALRGSSSQYSLDGTLGLTTKFGEINAPYSARGSVGFTR